MVRILLGLVAIAAFAADPNEAIFTSRMQPLLAKQCSSCHGVAQPAGGLSMGSLAKLQTGGKRGAAIVPGKSKDSLLIKSIRGEVTPRMPLGGELPSADVELLAKAIDEMKPAAAPQRDPHIEWLTHAPKRPDGPAGIDGFVMAKLRERGLQPSPPASKRALLRRVFIDLVGMPPTLDEAETFLNDTSSNAYEKLIDRLLADPRYGERWGRHWLDLVRFAESDGFAIDGERPTAWRYRDYVIRSFNSDKPYDTFVKEQIAGDEMQGGDRSERLVAMGFLRMGTWEADANFKTQLRQDFLNEATATTSSVFLGFTTGCARCHDHKYDPIPTRDFYRLQAFFAATKVDDRPAAWTKPEGDAKKMKLLLRTLEDEAEAAAEEQQKADDRFKKLYTERKKLKPGDKAANEYTRALKDKKNTDFSDAERREYTEIRDRARMTGERAARYRPMAYSVSDVTPPQVPAIADTYVLGGGELAARGEKVEPGFLSSVTGNSEPAKIPFAGGSSGRRTALADWIASPDNPLTARVMVNRIWQHHFGEGLVRTPSDFGRNGDRPTHPELLDWLATEFVARKWSIKSMHKLMLMSETYQRSTTHPAAKEYASIDPDNRLLWRMNWLRLESETLRDSILAACGELQPASGGPGRFLDIPADMAEGFEFFRWFPSSPQEQRVRSIYTFQRRSVTMPMMEVFDVANMSESCARRNVTVVPPQAFALLNSKFANDAAQALAKRARELAGPDRDKQIERAFRLTLTRAPSAAELEKARTVELDRLALVLFNLNEFLYLE